MAARASFNQTASLVDRLTIIQGQFVINGTSDPTSVQGNGITSVVRNSAGKFTVTLSEAWNKLLCVDAVLAGPSAGTTAGCDNVAIDTVPSAGFTSVVLRTELNNAAADPTSGSTVLFLLHLRNSTLKGKGE